MSADRIGATLVLAFACGYAVLISNIGIIPGDEISYSARSMPIFLSILAIPLSLWMIVKPGADIEMATWSSLNWRLLVAFCAMMSLYGLALRPLGFLLSTAIFLACGFYVLGERSYWLIMSFAIGVAGVFWWLMSEMLGVYLPALPEWAIFEQVAT